MTIEDRQINEFTEEGGNNSVELKSGSLVVFFSFDLVNSTKYKNINRTGWPFVIRKFYETVIDCMTKWLDEFNIWKYVGDEVLCYKNITHVDQLRKTILAAKQVVNNTIDTIHRTFPGTKKLVVYNILCKF